LFLQHATLCRVKMTNKLALESGDFDYINWLPDGKPGAEDRAIANGFNIVVNTPQAVIAFHADGEQYGGVNGGCFIFLPFSNGIKGYSTGGIVAAPFGSRAYECTGGVVSGPSTGGTITGVYRVDEDDLK
jgi:hypothetical protein